jgi:uncharacterized protein YggE
MTRLFGALVAALFLATPVVAAEAAPPVPTLTVSADGSVGVVPDIVVITIGVVTDGKTAAEALGANSDAVAKAIAALKAAGVADRDIGTSGLNVNPVYAQPPQRPDGGFDPAVLTGYQVSNQLRVTLRDIGKAGSILDAVVGAGANQINSFTFDVSDRQKPSDEALKRAVAEAKRKAEFMAEAAGVRLVRILTIGSNSPYPVFDSAPNMVLQKAVPIMPGEQQVTANVSIVFEIAAK